MSIFFNHRVLLATRFKYKSLPHSFENILNNLLGIMLKITKQTFAEHQTLLRDIHLYSICFDKNRF